MPGPTGLLSVPTAEVADEGSVHLGINAHDPVPPRDDNLVNYLFTIGFAPGLELGGRIAQREGFEGNSNDLSLNAKWRLWQFDGGPAFAVGATDIGGEAQHFRSSYLVATWPVGPFSFTGGYQRGPDLPKGALGGLEWRPFSALAVYAEYDTAEVNPGLRLRTPPLWGGLRLAANAGWRSETQEVEGGIELSFPLGRPSPAASPRPLPAARGEVTEAAIKPEVPPTPQRPLPDGPDTQGLREALHALGFESVRTGARAGGVLLVRLENRSYNHSSADGIGVALGTIAMRAPAAIERIELTVTAYGVPQVMVATSAPAYRAFLDGGGASPDLLEVSWSGGLPRETYWHNPPQGLSAMELFVEPVLRTFVATEYGVIDAGLGVRGRLVMPLGGGVSASFGAQVPLALTDDFRDDRNFSDFAPEAGMDLLLLQGAKKLAPWWTLLWSVGSVQLVQTDLGIVGVEQAWTPGDGRHRFTSKLMLTDTGLLRREILLAGYTWFDAARDYSASLTAGQFYAEDTGVRIDVNRWFGDTLAGVFLKYESRDNMAGGFQISLPLTPRRDSQPDGVQVKGLRRWGHLLQTTLNLADQTNTLKPLLLVEPTIDLDLRRDFLDSNRLGPEYLRAQLPRMREAYLTFGR